MRTLCFNGKFGYKSDTTYDGLIVFCHFDPSDNEKILTKAAKSLIKLQSNKQIILVPFVHLDTLVAEPKIADALFSFFGKTMEELSQTPIIRVPFGITKEFNLYAPANDEAIKFRRFTH